LVVVTAPAEVRLRTFFKFNLRFVDGNLELDREEPA
jgi:hypothetical protein